MEDNPYASPKPEINQPPDTGRLLLRLLAVCFWLMSLLLVFGIVTSWNRPEITARSAENPVFAAAIWTVGFILPALGLAVLGLASWRRRWVLAFIGLAGFMPLLVFISYFGIRRAMG